MFRLITILCIYMVLPYLHKYHSWFELGVDVGLEIIGDEEVEEEVDRIEEDEEVARIYENTKETHRKIMTGEFKINTVL